MALQFTPLHPRFVAESGSIALRGVDDTAVLDAIRDAMNEYAVVVFRDQAFEDDEQLAFARRFDGTLHEKTGSRVIAASRLGNEALTDVSNVAAGGGLLAQDDRRRLYSLANRLWHTDASFESPPGRYSLLHARVVPPNGPATEFADMRAAYDALDDRTKERIEGLEVHHSIAYSRSTLGFEFTPEEAEILWGAIQPLVRRFPSRDRRSLYLASHASRILGWSLPEGRLLLRELMEHATQREFVYAHEWRAGDLVIYDNRVTMHRARPFDDGVHRRELRRVTTLDVDG